MDPYHGLFPEHLDPHVEHQEIRLMRNNRSESVFLLLGLAVLVVVTGNFFQGLIFAETADRYEDLEWFADALDKIDTEYVEELSSHTLVEGAITGMISSLDRHSSYLSAEHLRQLEEDTSGEYVGIGIKIFLDQEHNNTLTVDSVFPNSPAFREGIMAGDKIIMIDDKPIKYDGTSTTYEMLDAAKDLIRGPRGTKVKLTVWRVGQDDGRAKRIIKTVRREKIEIKSIAATKEVAAGIGYVRIADFNEHTVADFKKEVDRLVRDDTYGLILDLRWNPGGLLRSAVDISNLFLPKGELIVSTRGRSDNEGLEYRAESGDRYRGIDVAVLINQSSASASEIVAAALHDAGRGTLFGTRSYGKGSVQTVIPLKNRTALRLTTHRYYTPNGISIEKNKGIEPDIEVPFSIDDQDRLVRQMRLEQNGAMAKQNAEQRAREHHAEIEYVERLAEMDLQAIVAKIYDADTTIESLREWLTTEAEKQFGDRYIRDVQLERAIAWLEERKPGSSSETAAAQSGATADRPM